MWFWIPDEDDFVTPPTHHASAMTIATSSAIRPSGPGTVGTTTEEMELDDLLLAMETPSKTRTGARPAE